MKPVTPSAIESAQTTAPWLPQALALSNWKAGWDRLSFCLHHSEPFREAEFHFSRMFKRSTGMAPHCFHLHCRFDRAKQLLLERQLSIAEIAYTIGFFSQGHFNYHFKRFVGVTPKTFLRQQ